MVQEATSAYTILGWSPPSRPARLAQIVHVEVDALDPARTTVVPIGGPLRASWKRFMAFGHPSRMKKASGTNSHR